jgi:hypothetical protein
MNATEVRVGNWILIPTNNEIKIPSYCKKIKAITLFGELDFTEPTYSESHRVPAINCAGIPLTEEILLKCGFIKTIDKQLPYQTAYNFDDFILDCNFVPCIDCGHGLVKSYGKEIKYFHDLQNVIYDLEGKELIINL